MVISKNQYKSYKQLSSNEFALLNAVEDFIVFSISTIKRVTGWKRFTISNTLTSLKNKCIITAVKKNNYVVSSRIPENMFKIATIVNSPSYISFWTAASYYGFTEQQINTIQVVSTKQFSKISILQHAIETSVFQPQKFYGYQKVNGFAIAEKEKLIVDVLYKPEKAGGIGEIKGCIRSAWPQISQKKLLSCIRRFGNKSIFARLGYLLEEMQLKNSMENVFLKNIPYSYTRLNPQKKPSQRYSRKWRVIVND